MVVGPALVAVNTQAGLILPYAECGGPVPASALMSLLLAALALGSGWVSWRARQAGPEAERTARFVAGLGALMALMFGFALLMQGAAGMILSGCER